ncbi:hypothetical protein, partial [Picosynechococcus sp. NKBG042902]|uniref:hypothetical protein n=1 Tax=Picosynechococcus sp. NKBG042902 TaxID=490193 RepID=UPI0005EDC90B
MKERSKKSRSILFSFLFKKDQKGYGFIVKPEDIDSLKSRQNLQILDEYKTGIYFKEKEIGPRLLSLLKKRYKRLSKKCFEHNIDIKYLAFGIYVEFEIDTFGKQAKNVELYNFKGLILSSFTSQTAFVCIQESFIENPILLKKVFFEDEVASLSLGVKKGGFYDILKKQSLDESKRKEVSIELLLNDKIRQKIRHRHIYTSLVNDYLNELNDNIKQQIKIEIRTALKSKDTPQETKDLYWKNITFLQKELEKESHLWDYATREIKAQVIREKYDAFFGCLEKFFKSSYRYKEYLNGSVATFYCLNEDELKLVNQWSGNNHSDSFMKMVSARAAEKVVQEYYRKTGYLSVKDISLTQVFSGNNEDWKLFDIEAIREDKVIYIDVKNARNSIYSKIYSKFCIRKHKRNKLGEAITIAGTLSPLDVLKSEVDQLCPNYT